MMTLEEVREELRHYNSKLSKVAEQAGVDKHAVYRLMTEGSKPAYETVKKLSDYLSGGEE